MGLKWRTAFCTSIQKDEEKDIKDKSNLSSRLGVFFSNPSTVVSSPTLRCRTTAAAANKSSPVTPKLQFIKTKHSSAPSSPRSPSTFSLLKSTLRLSKMSRCGICLQSVKTGQGTAIFTAECGHSFHFPCIAAHVRKQGSLTCPICSSTWKEMHLLNTSTATTNSNSNSKNDKRCVLKVYNDDEPLSSPTSGARFNPILESDETEEENDEFPGFFVTNNVVVSTEIRRRNLEMALLPEAAVVSVGKTRETYAVVLKLKAPAAAVPRPPIDLVSVLNVSRGFTPDKLHLMKRMMRMVVSSLSAADRLSIVAFSSTSKRVLPLRRMTTSGRRSARRIIDAIVSLDSGSATSAVDALKKAAKVIEDRREKNTAASILLFSDIGHRSGSFVTSTRFSSLEIPLHSVSLSACLNAPLEDTLSKCITGLLSEVMQDVRVQLGFASRSAPGEISAVYSYTGKPAFLGSGSGWCRVGDLFSEEERELLIEIKIPSSLGGSHRLLSVRCSYKDSSTQQPITYDKESVLLIPRPRAVGSSSRDIQRLRCLFVTTRAIAESRRMVERNDVAGAHHMLASARALVLQSATGSAEEFVRGLEAELAELNHQMQQPRRRNNHQREHIVRADEKMEPLTPTSAWRAAERLAKLAIMRKSLNRVSDLHGFENARF